MFQDLDLDSIEDGEASTIGTKIQYTARKQGCEMLLYLLNAERILPIYTRSLCMVAQKIGQFSWGRVK